jgi:hypothetical protein
VLGVPEPAERQRLREAGGRIVGARVAAQRSR